MARMRAAAFVLSILLSGCLFGGGVPETSYYTLHGDLPKPHAATQPRFNLRLGVEEFRIAGEYRTDRIVYRPSPFEIGYYNYYRWAASPEVLVRRRVIEYLSATNLFAVVEHAATLARPDLYLEGTIEQVEEVDAADRWSAHLVLALAVREPGDKIPLVHRRFDVSRAAASRSPLEIVKAMSALVDQVAREFAAAAEKALAERRSS